MVDAISLGSGGNPKDKKNYNGNLSPSPLLKKIVRMNVRKNKCHGFTLKNKPCKLHAKVNSDFCYHHESSQSQENISKQQATRTHNAPDTRTPVKKNVEQKMDKPKTPLAVKMTPLPFERDVEKEIPTKYNIQLIPNLQGQGSLKKPDIQRGDLIITKGWIGPPFLTYAHAGIVIEMNNMFLKEKSTNQPLVPVYACDVVDCLYDGCGISRTVYGAQGKREVRVVRLKSDFPKRNEIIAKVIEVAIKIMQLPNVKYANIPYQFGRLLTGRCFRTYATFDEAREYYSLLKEYLNGGPIVTQKLAFFCSRFSLLMYQLAILMLEDGNVDKLHPFFAYEPKYCRPSHVADLSQNPQTKPFWEQVDITGFRGLWFRI